MDTCRSFSSTVSKWLKLTIQEKVQKTYWLMETCITPLLFEGSCNEFQTNRIPKCNATGSRHLHRCAIDSTVCMEQVLQTRCIIQIPTNLLTLSYTTIDKTTHIHGFIRNHSLTGESFGHASPIPAAHAGLSSPEHVVARERGDSKLFLGLKRLKLWQCWDRNIIQDVCYIWWCSILVMYMYIT